MTETAAPIALTSTAARVVLDSASVLRRSVMLDTRAAGVYVRVDLTLRAYPCPYSGMTRYARVLDSDELSIYVHDTEAAAVRAYEALVSDCEHDYQRDGRHAWHVTDVAGMPVEPMPAGAPEALADARPVAHFAPEPEDVRAAACPTLFAVGDTVEYAGTITNLHGPCRVLAVEATEDGGERYTLRHIAAGHNLHGVRPRSISPAA